MGWYRADTSRSRHPKIRLLARLLGVHRLHAVGIHEVLCSVPTETMQVDGSLGRLDPRDFADDCDFEGDPAVLWAALIEAGLIDKRHNRYFVHDYADWAGSTKEAKRKAEWRSKKDGGSGPPERDSPGTETGRSQLRTDVRTDERTNDPDPPQPPTGGGPPRRPAGEGSKDAERRTPPPGIPGLVLLPTDPPAPKAHRLEPYVAAWNRGRAGSKISEADPPGSNAKERDKLWLRSLDQYPDPADWEWCAKALATSPHHCGANGWGPATVGWVLKRGNGHQLEEWMRKGRGLRAGTWAAPTPPMRPPGRSPEATMAWDQVVLLARRGAFTQPGQAPPELDDRTKAALRACRGGAAIARADREEFARLKRAFVEVFESTSERTAS